MSLLPNAEWIAIDLVLVGVLLTLWRIARGPALADRIVGLDLLSILVVAALAALSIHTDQSAYLDVAIAYALIAFLGTVALARFLERRSDETPDRGSGQGEGQE